MKKTLLALAIPAALVAAGASAQGVSVYNQDGVNVKVGGEVEVRYTQPFELFNAKKDGSISYDDTYFFLDADMALTDDLSAVAYMKFDADSEADTVAVDDRYVGFASKTMGTLVFGSVSTFWDDNADSEMAKGLDGDAATVAGYVNKNAYAAGTAENTTAADATTTVQGVTTPLAYHVSEFGQADQAIKYTFENDMFFAGALYALSQDDEAANKNDYSIAEVQLGFRMAGFTVDGIYQNVDEDAADGYEQDAYALIATYSFDAFQFNLGYKNLDMEKATSYDEEVSSYSLAGSYAFGLNTVKAGYDRAEGDKDLDGLEANTFYVNYTRQLHSNVSVFAEVSHTDVDRQGGAVKQVGSTWDGAASKAVTGTILDGSTVNDKDTAFLVGMEVAF